MSRRHTMPRQRGSGVPASVVPALAPHADGYHAGIHGPTAAPHEPRRVNPIENLIRLLQGLATNVPDLLLPVLVALAGTIPFVEGEVSSVIGIFAGLDPVVSGLAGAIGNFASVLVVVLLGSRIRARSRLGGPPGAGDRRTGTGRRRSRSPRAADASGVSLVRYGVPERGPSRPASRAHDGALFVIAVVKRPSRSCAKVCSGSHSNRLTWWPGRRSPREPDRR